MSDIKNIKISLDSGWDGGDVILKDDQGEVVPTTKLTGKLVRDLYWEGDTLVMETDEGISRYEGAYITDMKTVFVAGSVVEGAVPITFTRLKTE